MKKSKPIVTFLCDSREQRGYHWTKCVRSDLVCAGTLVTTLGEGDYSIGVQGHDTLPIRIERKSLSDLFGVCGYGRERFERELERLGPYERRYIAVEASWSTILAGFDRSTITGRIVAASLASWIDDHGLIPIMDDNRQVVSGICRRALEEFASRFLKSVALGG